MIASTFGSLMASAWAQRTTEVDSLFLKLFINNLLYLRV